MERVTIPVEVAYATSTGQAIVRIEMPPDASVEATIRASGILDRFPEIDLERQRVGIFGEIVRLDAVVGANDRIEIYRPLIVDPKETRRMRAARRGKSGTGS